MSVAADVAVVGGGVVGCSAALELARQGNRVTLYEAHQVGRAASGRNAGAIRAHGRHQTELALATASLERWAALARDSDTEFYFSRDGDLVVGFTPEEEARLAHSTAAYRELGLEVELLSGADARARVPSLSDEITVGAFCPSDAMAYPPLAVRAIAELAHRAGATIVQQAPVEAIHSDAGRVSGVTVSGERLDAGAIVLAAGPWTGAIPIDADVNLAIAPRRSQILVTERVGPMLGPFLSGNGVYCRQSPFGNLVIGGGGRWERADFDTSTSIPTVHRLVSRCLRLLPDVRRIRVLRAWAGAVELTPDHRPLLGPVECLEGLVVAAGFCGNGFALGPVAGKIAADLINGAETGFDLAPFRPDRFPGAIDLGGELRARAASVDEPIDLSAVPGPAGIA